MVPSKGERFEMRLEEEALERIDNWRRSEGDIPSRSEAIRRLIDLGLAAKQSRDPQITDGEKLILLMLADLSRGPEARGEFDASFIESTIYGGHYWGLRWQYGGIFHGHKDDSRIVAEVVDILDMWHFLETGFRDLSAADKERVRKEAQPFGDRVSFPGFDGNNESDHGSIMTYLIEKLDRFPSFKARAHLNSHFPTLTGYRRMLSVFLPMRETLTGGGLNAASIINVLNASRHPGQPSDLAN